MPNRFDSGIAVLHPSGEVHSLEIPPDMSMADVHASLSDYYQPSQPTREGAVEYSSAFRQAAKQAVGLARLDESRRKHGANAGGEAGFSVDRSGSTSPVTFSQDKESTRGSLQQTVSPNTLGLFHTHDSYHQSDPSGPDIAVAKKARTVVYVASRDGLYAVDPAGVKTKVFSNPNWFDKK
jgi:hypothetical protein